MQQSKNGFLIVQFTGQQPSHCGIDVDHGNLRDLAVRLEEVTRACVRACVLMLPGVG